MKAKLARRFSLIAAATILAGCTTTPLPSTHSPEADPANAVVVFSLTHDLAGGTRNQALIYLDDGLFGGKGGRAYTSSEQPFIGFTRESDFPEVLGYLYVVTLPVGPHEFMGWQISNGTGLRIFPKPKPPALKFDLKPGEVKYLGSFHGNLERGENFFGRTITGGGVVSVGSQLTRDTALLLKRYPQFAGKVQDATLFKGLWLSPQGETDAVVNTPPMPVPAKKN